MPGDALATANNILFIMIPRPPTSTLFPYRRSSDLRKFSAFHDETGRLNVDGMNIISNDGSNKLNRSRKECRSEERFSRNAETDLVCRLLLEKKKSAEADADIHGSAS